MCNYHFGDYHWYGEFFAHALVKHHIQQMSSDPMYSLEANQLDKIEAIRQRLFLVEKGSGVKWGDDLPVHLLGSFEAVLQSFASLK
ncbi:MAG: hypothetical protein ACXU9U_03400 [Parachlamydiaceae bacterium]